MEAITQGIRISVQTEYLEDQSQPDQSFYLFAYHIKISNQSTQSVQLISRHWIITNGEGKKEEVRGEGVIGQQPSLMPGESFEYTSFCPLNTPMGTMQGSYWMEIEGAEGFRAAIPKFEFKNPYTLH
ncbi:MAG: Co2+/Mg2+ efflux protein ApaG [Deltaproteobacteria bacterium]|nr:Co2+/Mg2+ efflux protein ApaG [Deltaproteobacteria bacterium]